MSTPSPSQPGFLRAILERTRELREEWVSLVIRLAELESPSTHPESQGPVQEVVAEWLEASGHRVEILPTGREGRVGGGILLATPAGASWNELGGGSGSTLDDECQLLLGHTDTVWPMGTLPTMPVLREGDRLRGPGVFDMKGGLALALLALRILKELELEPPLPPVLLLNSDEEIGSLDSTEFIRSWARRAWRVFVLEPALGPQGRLKTTRKGTGTFRIRIHGRSSHAGLAPEEGASAILEMAHRIVELHALARPEEGTTVNVGTVRGGERPNVVPPWAEAEVDVRVATAAEGRRMEREIRALAEATPTVAGTRMEVEGSVDRPPLEATQGNQALWQAALEVAGALEMPLGQGAAGGASDGNTTSLLAPTLDGLGAVGEGAHAVHEALDIPLSLDRAALLAGLMLRPR